MFAFGFLKILTSENSKQKNQTKQEQLIRTSGLKMLFGSCSLRRGKTRHCIVWDRRDYKQAVQYILDGIEGYCMKQTI